MPVNPIKLYTETALDLTESAVRAGKEKEDSSRSAMVDFIEDKLKKEKKQVRRKQIEKFLSDSGVEDKKEIKKVAESIVEWEYLV